LAPSDDAGQVSPVAPPVENELSREQELAKLEKLEAPEGVDLVLWNELKSALAALLPDKIVSTPPLGEDNAVGDLDFFRDEEEAGWLTWSFELRGDYNVDGIVNVDDLSMIAEHYGEVIGEENAWLASVDSSGNGVIDIADVTGIALNYGTELSGFNVISGGPGFIDWEEIGTVDRTEAEALMGGVLLFAFAADSEDWADFGVLAYDSEGSTGEMSNVLEYRQPRIISVDAPSGAIGDFYTASAVVEGEEPFTYRWVLGNGVSPSTSEEPAVEVELVQQGMFSGHLAVSNRFDERRQDFFVTVGVPPTVTSVAPLAATTGERVDFTAEVTGTTPITYIWDFGRDAFPRTSAEQSPQVQFDEDGVHDCDLRVSNSHGSFRYEFQVTTGSPPTIVNIFPAQGAQGDDVQFYAEMLGSEPFSYSWTFTGVGDPTSSTDRRPTVTLNWAGDHQCKLVVANDYGETTRWFTFHVGVPPRIFEVFWTTTVGNTVCWFFADIQGDLPMTYRWTMDLWPPDPPMVFTLMPQNILTGDQIGTFNCTLEATNEFGSDSFDFEYEITEIEEPPL